MICNPQQSYLLNKSICWCSVTKSRLTLCDHMDSSVPGFPVLHHLLECTQTHVHESVMLFIHLILCCPLLLLPSIFPSIKVFSNQLALHIKWPKYWSYHIRPSNEYSGFVSFRMDQLDLLAFQGTPKSFSNTTVQKHQFFSTQLFLQSNSHIPT